jgi:membrane associated rhomboid family serine protease
VSEPDLFVVCKNCSSEVSPYVTECPYCGQRVRKRAPKIERRPGIEEPVVKQRRARPPRLSSLKRGEIPGIAAETRPYATIALIVISLAVTVVVASGQVAMTDLGALFAPVDNGEWWRIVTTPFVYDTASPFYEFIALAAVGVFGTMVERRFGSVAVVAVFIVAGAGGAALASVLEDTPALGANGAALGLLFAWLVDDYLARRRGADRGNDLIGVAVFALVLLLVPLADTDASMFAGLGGAAVGAVAGTVMSPFRP